MQKQKENIEKRTKGKYIKLTIELLKEFFVESGKEVWITEEELLFYIREPQNEFITLHFHEEVIQLVLIRTQKVIRLWEFPHYINNDYDYCPDQRIMTHRLIGKPALGPSPPCSYYNHSNNTGFVYNRLHLN